MLYNLLRHIVAFFKSLSVEKVETNQVINIIFFLFKMWKERLYSHLIFTRFNFIILFTMRKAFMYFFE